MNATPYSDALVTYGGKRAAARAMGLPYATFHGHQRKEVGAQPVLGVTIPKLPKPHMPIDKLLDQRSEMFRRKQDWRRAVDWFNISVHDDLPLGVLWFGDPHIDSDECNIDLLREHVSYCVTTPGLYGANIGDTTNNWVGRLMRLFATQEASQSTARQLAEWFLSGSGVTWLAWIMGNHDEWNDGADILRRMNIHGKVPMLDWEAKFQIAFKGGTVCRVHAAHDFPGSSIYNPLHGPTKAARFGGQADLYVCGHKHNPAYSWMPTENGRCPVLVRARGYKWHDSHAVTNGFPQYPMGAAMLTIIDPTASDAGRVSVFPDVAQGVKVLKALRGGR